MAEKKITYLNRNFEDYRRALLEYTQEHYPQIFADMDDASIGSWMIDLLASVSDNLSFYIDKAYNETNIDCAQEKSSVYSMARSAGLKIPGPTPSIAVEKFSCELPVKMDINNNSKPDYDYAPVIKAGTRLQGGGQTFEVMEDIDFSKQFGPNGESNHTIRPKRNANNEIVGYKVETTSLIASGESEIYSMYITKSDVRPFMEIVIPVKNILNVESIIFKVGGSFQTMPNNNEFYMNREFLPAADSPTQTDTYRFFEVDSLVEPYRWGDKMPEGCNLEGKPITEEYGYVNDDNPDEIIPTTVITKGEWKPLSQKFITEYTDKGYLRIIFGSGEEVGRDITTSAFIPNFTRFQISKIVKNDMLGKLPRPGMTMYVKYRVGGGTSSNLAPGTIRSISLLNLDSGGGYENLEREKVNSVKQSIRVTNITSSISGKDMPSVEEIKAMIKYNASAQERCVTLKDYENRVFKLPSRYGTCFRCRAVEENNKVMLYVLGVDGNGKLSTELPELLKENIQDYLSHYRMLNDFIEIKPGRIVNVSIECDFYADKNYNKGDVGRAVIDCIYDYMDINKHELGEDIFLGDLQKEIGKIDGVINLIDLRVYNETGADYSKVLTSQQSVDISTGQTEEADRMEIDLEASDYILNSEYDEMFEIKYKDKDIRLRIKTR